MAYGYNKESWCVIRYHAINLASEMLAVERGERPWLSEFLVQDAISNGGCSVAAKTIIIAGYASGLSSESHKLVFRWFKSNLCSQFNT